MKFDLNHLPTAGRHFPYDLVTDDGWITNLEKVSDTELKATVFIENIAPNFIGYQIPEERIYFNLKSTLAQVGVEAKKESISWDKARKACEVHIILSSIGPIGKAMLSYITIGAYVGKLFAADERRRVRDPDYLARMFGRSDRQGKPLLSLGGLHGSDDLILDKVDGRTVAYLTLQNGRVLYDASIEGFLPTLGKALVTNVGMRSAVRLHQEWHPLYPRNVHADELLLVKTLPLHIRTVYGKVVDDLVSHGYKHTSASILQPDTEASGDIYEFYGDSKRELTDVPLEFYTLEPYREHVFFQDRDQLQTFLEDSKTLSDAFATAPQPLDTRASTFVVKGDQLIHLTPEDWISTSPRFQEFPGQFQGSRQALMVERYIEQQPSYPYLKAIEDGIITSQGILLTRYFPSPLMKRMLLSFYVQRCLKRIYFQIPSHSYGDFFSAEDRALLHDLEKFAIPVYWVDQQTGKILQYVQKPERDSGMFVPLDSVDKFIKSTMFGIYGSNLEEGVFADELKQLLEGIQKMKLELNHPLLNKDTPLALVTGGGPGAMEVGNRVAKELCILSCANIVDFSNKSSSVVNEQHQNPYIEAKMTYRIDKLVERQAEFHLDFPIFLMGGIGTDFEYSLEEVRRKVGSVGATPILLFGTNDYWKSKVTSRFNINLETGTIKGSEWISNSFYCIQKAEEGIAIYKKFFTGTLPIGKQGPIYKEGFVPSGTISLESH
ncbi:MAG: LOG family protein [Parachlamydiaceae bacterium]